MKIIVNLNKNQLLAIKYESQYIIYLVFGEKCAPCKELKPKLIYLQKNDSVEHEFNLVLINYNHLYYLNYDLTYKKYPFSFFARTVNLNVLFKALKWISLFPFYKIFPALYLDKKDELDFDGDFDF